MDQNLVLFGVEKCVSCVNSLETLPATIISRRFCFKCELALSLVKT